MDCINICISSYFRVCVLYVWVGYKNISYNNNIRNWRCSSSCGRKPQNNSTWTTATSQYNSWPYNKKCRKTKSCPNSNPNTKTNSTPSSPTLPASVTPIVIPSSPTLSKIRSSLPRLWPFWTLAMMRSFGVGIRLIWRRLNCIWWMARSSTGRMLCRCLIRGILVCTVRGRYWRLCISRRVCSIGSKLKLKE